MKKQTVFDYLNKYGNYSFIGKEFNEVDGAILALLTYFNYKDVVPSLGSNYLDVPLYRLSDDSLLDYLLEGTVTTSTDSRFFPLACKSKRFGNISLNYCFEKFDKELAIQFFAITYILDNDIVCVSFRGTDSSLVGWKEDLMMAVNDYLPSYIEADAYLETIGKIFNTSKIIVIGHSKGGALAVHASSHASKDIQDRIINVYDFDGPGFRKALDNLKGYENIKSRIIKIIPIDSVIGILLESSTRAKVIKAAGFSLAQHSPYMWYIDDDHFIEVEQTTSGSAFWSYNMHDFLETLNDEEKVIFIDKIFSLVEQAKIDTVHDFLHRVDKKLFASIKALINMMKDEQTRDLFKKIIVTFIKIYFKNASSFRTRRKIDFAKANRDEMIALIIKDEPTPLLTEKQEQ